MSEPPHDAGEAPTSTVLTNDLKSPIEVKVDGDWEVLYPRRTLTLRIPVATAEVRLREDRELQGRADRTTIKLSASESFGAFGEEVQRREGLEAEAIMREARRLRIAERLRQAAFQQEVSKSMCYEHWEAGLKFAVMFVITGIMIVCVVLIPPGQADTAALLACGTLLPCCCINLKAWDAKESGELSLPDDLYFSVGPYLLLPQLAIGAPGLGRLYRARRHPRILVDRIHHMAHGMLFHRLVGVSFLRFAGAWDRLVEGARGGGVSAAVVFLPEGTDDFGNHDAIPPKEHLQGSCWCVPLYGEKKPWGCRWWSKWIENIEQAVEYGAELEVYFFPGRLGQGRVQSFMTAGQEHLRRDSINARRAEFEDSDEMRQALAAGLQNLSLGEREDGSSQYSREVQRLFMAWLPPDDRNFMEASEGLGNSQKAEVAWLERKGYAYTRVDVATWLSKDYDDIVLEPESRSSLPTAYGSSKKLVESL
ncbi:hypothetical protein AK812_SmicGene21907 [Symbiodinium microadriaticum]|uniref:Uncharacterized protein n=1 Tax=Symbiodinium microadriaticum TaxID=2951 RepID=A0A1Q9DL90_SYMMI|nr:hypothetical protein AK812_SmicGene21907 [Symbiodinium microadriaticum]